MAGLATRDDQDFDQSTPRLAHRFVGRFSLLLYRSVRRGWAKLFSLSASGAFASFGARTVIEPPVRLSGEGRISIGRRVYIGAGSWLQVIGEGTNVALRIGDGTSIAGSCVLSATLSVTLGRNVLVARNVYIADHRHAFEDAARPVLEQGIEKVARVEVGDGAWLGENVVIGPGVRIGRGAVIGANAVVLDDVPPYSVAAGAPARVARTFA